MKKNKYIVFAAIGFELISLILVALWIGQYLAQKGYGATGQAISVLVAFLIWFISLIAKLKGLKSGD